MRKGLAISSVLHGAILLWAIVTFSATPFEAANTESLVDIVSDRDFKQMIAGSEHAPKSETPKPLVEKVAEVKPNPDPTPKVTEKKEIVTAAEAPPPPQKTETKPEKKQPEQKTDPIAEALKKDDTKKKEEKKEEEKKVVDTRPVPMPPRKPPQQKFDPAKVAALLDKRDPQRQAATGAEISRTASLGFTSGSAPELSQSELDALRNQIQACWSPPAGTVDAKQLIVKVQLLLNQDGSVQAQPTVTNRSSHPQFQLAAEAALRAIRRCQPYKLPIAKYQSWRDVEVTFDPKNMFFGG